MFLNKSNLKFCSVYLAGILSLLISTSSFARCEVDENFPLRAVFLTVNCIDLDNFAKKVDKQELLVVDARSSTEYQIIKIKDAVNISIEDKNNFIEQVKVLHKNDPRPMVFYCNGQRCNLSYKAAALALKIGIKDVLVFDDGIFKYSKIRPENTLLLDNEISQTNKLISKEQFTQHLLSSTEFNKKIIEEVEAGEKFNVLDIRTKSNRLGLSAFVGVPNEKYISINRTKKLKHYLNKVAENNESLFVYDWSGKQLKWIQYYINDYNIENYYFLKGGASAKINQELKDMGLPEMLN